MDTQIQLNELKQAMKQTKDRRLFERYQAVYLYLDGHTMNEVAQIIGRTRKTVSSYVSSYRKAGLDGLVRHHSNGRPRRLTADQEASLATIVSTKLPSDVALGMFANWTLALMIMYVEREWGVTYTVRGMSLLMERLGLSYTRPTYTLAKANPEKQRVFLEETFPDLKKN